MNPTQEKPIVTKGKCPKCSEEIRSWRATDKYGSEIEVNKCGCGRTETVTKQAEPRDYQPKWY